MNTFYEYEGIIGKAETAHLGRTLQECFELAAAVRRKLGKQDYLLDKYISMILEGVNATLLYSAAESGFSASSELRHLCLAVMDRKTDCTEHPMYEKAQAYIAAHPLEYQERCTKLNLYCIALASDFLEYAADKYDQQQKEVQRAVFDIVYLRDLYRKIGALLGSEEPLEQLNLLLHQRFMLVTPMVAFLQGLTNDLLYALTSRDVETNRLAVQLRMEQD